MSKSRIVQLRAGQRRDAGRNTSTVGISADLRTPGGIDFSIAFARHYADFAATCRAFEQPGLAIVAVDLTRACVAGIACIAAEVGRPNALIIGRHSEADLILDSDDTFSLRHIAIVVEPVARLDRPGEGVSYRVVDLNSVAGIELEDGRKVGGLRADGPAFFATGTHGFFVFVTGDPTDWPEHAHLAWSFIPERIYLEEHPRLAEGSACHRSAPERGAGRPGGRTTLIRNTRQARAPAAGLLLAADESPVAELRIVGSEHCECFQVGAAALDSGILLGRDERCHGASALGDQSLSRVHLLIIEVAGSIVAIDISSTNGTFALADLTRPFRVFSLGPDDLVVLGRSVAVQWCWVG